MLETFKSVKEVMRIGVVLMIVSSLKLVFLVLSLTACDRQDTWGTGVRPKSNEPILRARTGSVGDPNSSSDENIQNDRNSFESKLHLEAPAEHEFTLMVIPDTQDYIRDDSGEFVSALQWIKAYKESQNIKFVSHVGDIVDQWDSRDEWHRADEQLSILETYGTDVPFGLTVGNHDMHMKTGEATYFQEWFPESRFAEHEWYGGSYKDNTNSYQFFEEGEHKFVVLHVECNAPDDVLEWVDDVLINHFDRLAIITTHMYLGPTSKPRTVKDHKRKAKGRMKWKKCHGDLGNTPQQMWDKSFRHHKNLRMVLSGDQGRTEAFHQTSEGVHGNTVHELMNDYRDGFIRLMRFDPKTDVVNVITASPHSGKLAVSTPSAKNIGSHQFTLNGWK